MKPALGFLFAVALLLGCSRTEQPQINVVVSPAMQEQRARIESRSRGKSDEMQRALRRESLVMSGTPAQQNARLMADALASEREARATIDRINRSQGPTGDASLLRPGEDPTIVRQNAQKQLLEALRLQIPLELKKVELMRDSADTMRGIADAMGETSKSLEEAKLAAAEKFLKASPYERQEILDLLKKFQGGEQLTPEGLEKLRGYNIPGTKAGIDKQLKRALRGQ